MNECFKAAGQPDGSGKSRPDVKTLERLFTEHKGKLDVNATGGDGRTALGFAANYGHASAVAFLLLHGADVNKYNNNPKERPLWWAACIGHAKAVDALIAGGAKVNEDAKFDAYRPTALHIAVYHGHAAVVRLLLENGADANVSNVDGETVAALAASQRMKDDVLAVYKAFAGNILLCACAVSPACCDAGTFCHECLLREVRQGHGSVLKQDQMRHKGLPASRV
jgi:hypothetical protein